MSPHQECGQVMCTEMKLVTDNLAQSKTDAIQVKDSFLNYILL